MGRNSAMLTNKLRLIPFFGLSLLFLIQLPCLQAAEDTASEQTTRLLESGVSLLREGRYKEAAQNLKAAIVISPERAELHHNFAIALSKQGENSAAIQELKKTLELRPTSSTSWILLGQ